MIQVVEEDRRPPPLLTQRVERSPYQLRLVTLTRLRWVAIMGQLATVVFVHAVLGFSFPVNLCLGLIALAAWANIVLRIRFPSRHRISPLFGALMVAFDTLQLAGLLYLTGGILNPFVFLLIAPVTVAAATLPARMTITVGLLSAACAVLLSLWHLPLPWYAGETFDLPSHYRYGILASVICGAAFIGFYAHRLAAEAQLMTDALAAAEHVLAREHRLQSLDGLAAAAAHELGTPLSTITVIARELERSLDPDSGLASDVRLLREQSQRCREILNTLTRRSGEADPLHSILPVSHLIDEVLEPHRGDAKSVAVDTAPRDGATGEARAEPSCVRNAGMIYGLTNIIDNAVDFSKSHVEVVARWDKKRVQIVVSDDGPGFDLNIMERLGEPFVTSRPANSYDTDAGRSSGLGLGFFIAKTLLERTGAEIDLANRPAPDQGAVVAITWSRRDFEFSDMVDDEPRTEPLLQATA